MEGRPRASLDSRTFQPRSSNSFTRPAVQPTKEEDFEDVGLEDPKPQEKKRGFLSRMVDSVDSGNKTTTDARPTSSHSSWHHITGRKRGQSGQGAELGSMAQPQPREDAPRPESGLKNENVLLPGTTQAPEIKVDS